MDTWLIELWGLLIGALVGVHAPDCDCGGIGAGG